MNSVWFDLISFLAVYTLAIVSPGPNFFLVVNSTLFGSRRIGLFTALGVATGSGLFGLAGLVGLIVILHSLPNFSLLLSLVGGGYLCWIGLSMIRSSFQARNANGNPPPDQEVAKTHAWRTGLLTNLTNPKAWAFYIALFTVVITPGFQTGHKVLINLSMFLISFAWYATAVLLISSARFRPIFQACQPVIQFLLGVLLIAMGGRIFVTM